MEIIKWLTLALVLLLGPVIVIHELGHFIFAKLAGARVLEFGFGLPPRLLTLAQQKGIIAVDGEEMILPPRFKLPKELEAGQRVHVVTEIDREGRLRVAQLRCLEQGGSPSGFGDRLEMGGEERPPAPLLDEGDDDPLLGERERRGILTRLEPGMILSLNLLPMGAFVRILGEEDPTDPQSLAARPKRWRVAAILAGPMFNLVAAFLLMTASYVSGIPERYFVLVEEIIPDTAAQAAGLQGGDVLLAVDGAPLTGGTEELRAHIVAAPEQELALTVLRDEQETTIAVTPRAVEGRGFLGIGMDNYPDHSSLRHYPLLEAMGAAGSAFYHTFAGLFRVPEMVASGQIEPADVRPSGLPGILQILGLALKQSIEWRLWFRALDFTAVISLAVGLTNLLPLPALDGGRLLFIAIEAVRGRRINPQTEGLVHFIGLAILLALSLVIIVQDIVNPLIPWALLSR